MSAGHLDDPMMTKRLPQARLASVVWPVLAALAILLIARAARAFPGVTEIDGFRVSSETPLQRQHIASVRRQIALVVALPVDPRVLAFFRQQPIIVRSGLGQHGQNVEAGILLNPSSDLGDRPVLLHELLHRYHARQLPGGLDNPVVARALEVARDSGDWPARSYMLSNKAEFFAMTASAVLHGTVGRPPNSRENVARNLPVYYRWIVREFGLSSVAQPVSRLRRGAGRTVSRRTASIDRGDAVVDQG